MSFNCITEIGGLDKLVFLTDLTLSNNRIKKVGDGLRELKELVFLSINNNKLENLGDMMVALKNLGKLQVLNCAGNSFMKDHPNYLDYIVHHMKDRLKYVDSKFIDEKMKKETMQEDKYKLEALENREDDALKNKDDTNLKDYEDLKMKIIYKYDENVLQDSPELKALLLNDKIFEQSRNTFKDAVKQLSSSMLGRVKETIDKRNNIYIKDYNEYLKAIETKAEQETLALIEKYFKRKKKVRLACEDKAPNWRAQVMELLNWMKKDFDRSLMMVETDSLDQNGVRI